MVFAAFGTSQSLFGGTQTGAFSATPAQSTGASGGLFGSSTPGGGFLSTGASCATGSGTTVKFVPVAGTDVVMKGGSQQSVSTKLQCITGMKEYEAKSLEVDACFCLQLLTRSSTLLYVPATLFSLVFKMVEFVDKM